MASSSLWPPDRKAMPATAAGTVRLSTRTVRAATSSTGACFAHFLPEITIDGFKGNRLYFRDWDRQLRQPLLIATHNAVIERAPLQGFLHQTNNMDTLGFDRRDSRCKP